MKILENMDLCYGCAACANICPKAAITMEPAKDGFLYPVINPDTCIECGACQKVCPQIHAQYENDREPKVYAMMADDEIRARSASGGVFSLLAELAFEQDGYVVGAAFAEDFRSVHHTMIHKREELDALRRSKYIQSENGDIYKQIKAKLDEDAFVLFVGTPCQCAALKSFLRKPYDKLLIVDLICHGAPSSYVWNKFLEEIAPDKSIKDVNFRYKGVKGWSATTHVEFNGGSEYTKLFKDCNFEQASSKNLVSRKSCGTCQFARVPRQGDLTIGDFWGVHTLDRALDDRKGTSAVLVNSEKGERAFEKLQKLSCCKKMQEMPFVKSFMRSNANVYRFPQTHPGRQKFFDALSAGQPFSEALKASKSEKYDIMLLSIWYAANFGSMMTNFALYKYLEDMGYNCIFADIPDHLWPTSIVHRNPQFITRRFGYKHFKITGKYKNRTDLKKVNNLADTFIVGSDQIWNYNLCKTAGTFFYLDFVDDDKKKIAYGTSFGHSSFRGNAEESKTAGFYLNRFDAVSVRENYAVDLCRDAFGVDAVQVLDPVFMCAKEHYLKCIDESRLVKNPPRKKYVLAYILDPTEEKQQALEKTAQQLDADLICIPNAQVKDDLRAKWRLPIVENIDMEDWLYYFKNAEMVITDSFHGSCFSVIFEKPFVAIGNKKRGLERFYSLLLELGLLDQLVLSAEEIGEKQLVSAGAIDYSAVHDKLESLRERSRSWLERALTAEKRAPSYSTYDVIDRRIDSVVAQTESKLAAINKEIAPHKDINKTLWGVEDKISAGDQQLADQIKQMQKQVNQISQQISAYQRKISYMENSLSWKITKPLRGLMNFVNKLRK